MIYRSILSYSSSTFFWSFKLHLSGEAKSGFVIFVPSFDFLVAKLSSVFELLIIATVVSWLHHSWHCFAFPIFWFCLDYSRKGRVFPFPHCCVQHSYSSGSDFNVCRTRRVERSRRRVLLFLYTHVLWIHVHTYLCLSGLTWVSAGQEESKGAEEERKEQEAQPTLCLRLWGRTPKCRVGQSQSLQQIN